MLVEALLSIAKEGQVIETVGTPYGRKYVVVGTLQGPSGERKPLVTVWIVRRGEENPRLVTAYPRQSIGDRHDS